MEPRAALWADRAAKAPTEATRLYASRRARSLTRDLTPRVAACGSVSQRARCRCPVTKWVPMTCRQHVLCGPCLARRSRRYGRRIREALAAALSKRSGHGSSRAKVVLITLSVRHTGDVEADRRALMAGWRALYKSMHRRGWGKFPYVGVLEVTPGTDGLGHVHAHVVAVWPWRDWAIVHKLWRRACPQSTRISLVAAKSPRGACRYIAKYVSKGVQGDDFTPGLRASVVAGMYGARWVFTSVRFWQPFDPCCQQCCAPVQLLVVQMARAYNGGRVPDDRPEWLVEATDWWFARRKPGAAAIGGSASSGDVPPTDERASARRA